MSWSVTRVACRRQSRCRRLRSLSGKSSPAPEPTSGGGQPSPRRGGLLKRSFIRYAIRFFVGCYLRVRRQGFERLPEPPYLLVFSHPNWVDPFLLASQWPRG